MNVRLFIGIVIMMAVGVNAYSQQMPKVCEPMPGFELNNVTHYTEKSLSLGDFKGKWLFLDFWFSGCASCIQSFPKINKLQEEFSDKAQFVMVGLNDKKYNKGIERVYERYREKKSLKMVAAYDSVLASKWGILSMPHIFVINPQGVLYNISDGRDFDSASISNLLAGKDVKMYRKMDDGARFDPRDLSGLESKVYYQSLLTRWSGESQAISLKLNDAVKNMRTSGSMNFVMVPLKFLYRLAYTGCISWDTPQDSLYGKVAPNPILEIDDSRPFEYDFNKDVGKGLYNYSLSMPPDRISGPGVMEIMKRELNNIFGYDVSLETRPAPVWKLIVTDRALFDKKIKSKGGVFKNTSLDDSSGGAAGFSVANYPIESFLNDIMFYLWMGQPPYFNETGFSGNIDIKFDAFLTDWNSVRKALNKNGMDLVKGTRDMRVIVIRNSNL